MDIVLRVIIKFCYLLDNEYEDVQEEKLLKFL